MAKKGAGEYILHTNALRMRVVGEGNLQMELRSLDAIRTYQALELPLETTNAIEPTRRVNFRSQRVQVVVSITEIDEWFRIDKMLIFAKLSAKNYPGTV